MEWSLKVSALAMGALHLAAGVALAAAPGAAVKGLQKFPRSVWPGRALALGALVWVALIVGGASLGRFDHLKRLLWPAAGVSYLLIIFFLDELLAPRALGGLLLLAAQPILLAARFHPSPLSRVISAVVYVWVVVGMILVLSPYRFRQGAAWMAQKPGGSLWAAVLLGIPGLACLLLGAWFF
ncbi:MAG: hypothetical protein R6X17_14860 [Candidatus Competibacteraceae bacterium]